MRATCFDNLSDFGAESSYWIKREEDFLSPLNSVIPLMDLPFSIIVRAFSSVLYLKTLFTLKGLTMKMNDDRIWLLEKANEEDNCIISVGGLVCRVMAETKADGNQCGRHPIQGEGQLRRHSDLDEIPEATRRVAFARLIELSRRKQRLTVEQLAEQADINISEIVEIEEGECTYPEPRTIYRLSKVLNFPQERLMVMSGLARTRNRRLTEATVRFAARSEPISVLSAEEEEALHEYVKVLVESVGN